MQLPDGHSENPSSGKNSLPKRELAVRPISPTRDYLKPQCDAFLTFLFSTGFNCSLTNHLDICAWMFVTGIVCYLDCFRALRSSVERLMQEWEFVPLALAAWDGSGRCPKGPLVMSCFFNFSPVISSQQPLPFCQLAHEGWGKLWSSIHLCFSVFNAHLALEVDLTLPVKTH